ncbi:MAG: SCO family protein [Candidatus Kapaibacteriales bacterium]
MNIIEKISSKISMFALSILVLTFLFSNNSTLSQDGVNPDEKLGIEENLGGYVDLDVELTLADGTKKKLRDILDKPTILTLVYYRCPGICNGLLNGLVDVIERVDLEPGEDYQVLSLSFDHTESHELALGKKNTYLSQFERNVDREDWLFATGDSLSVKSVTDSVGFYYQMQEWQEGRKDFLHAGALIFVNQNGLITRYLNAEEDDVDLTVEFLPFNIKMAVVESAKGTPRPTINSVLDYCFKYDPEGKTYVFDLLKVIGTTILLTIGIFITYLVVSSKKDKKEKEVS